MVDLVVDLAAAGVAEEEAAEEEAVVASAALAVVVEVAEEEEEGEALAEVDVDVAASEVKKIKVVERTLKS